MAGGTAGVAMWAVAIPPDASHWNKSNIQYSLILLHLGLEI
jgi:hypothetical protein